MPWGFIFSSIVGVFGLYVAHISSNLGQSKHIVAEGETLFTV